MKIQDIVFIAVFVFLALRRNPRLSVYIGLFSLLLSIPLFSFWIFFTAERLTWYAAAFFLLAIVFSMFKLRSNGKKRGAE